MSENPHVDFFVDLHWTETTEELLLSWADIAMCYTWIFDRAFRRLGNLNYRFTLPIIVLSTITGTISIGLNSLLPPEQVETGQKVVGGVNILTGIMTTIQNYYRYAQQTEANQTASNDWARLHRNIKIELSIEREFRKPATDFVKSVRQEYERLLNARPTIDTQILEDFRKEIKNSDVIKPEILDLVQHTLLDRDKNIIELYKGPKEPKLSLFNRIRSSITKSNSLVSPRSKKDSTPIKENNNILLRTMDEVKRQKVTNINSMESPPSYLLKDNPVEERPLFLKDLKRNMYENEEKDYKVIVESREDSTKEDSIKIQIHENI
jgi:hypothetical protein